MICIRSRAAACAAIGAALCALSAALPAMAGAPDPGEPPHPFAVRDLLATNRIADLDSSPDGRRLTYTLETADLAANEFRSAIWLLNSGDAKPEPVRLTDVAHDHAAIWDADGRYIHFLSARSGSVQVWRMEGDGRNPMQVTNLPLDVGSFRLSPRADRIFVTLRVFRHCRDIGCTKQRLFDASQSPGSALVRNQLFVGHGDEWEDGRRSQLYSIALDKKGIAGGDPVKLTIDIEGDVPGRPYGGREDYSVSPDGQRLAFSERDDGAKESWLPNADIWTALASGGERAPNGRPLKDADPVNITPDDRTEDTQPAFSPDGSQLAYLAADRPGASPNRHLVLRDFNSGAQRLLPGNWDHAILRFAWTPDGRNFIALSDHQGARTLWRIDARTGAASALTSEIVPGGGSVEAFSVGGNRVYYAQGSLDAPPELYSVGLDGTKLERMTRLNEALLGGRRLGAVEAFSYPGWNRESVHGYLLKPADFDPGHKYPLVVILHDGPHESLGNGWDWRLNAQLIAAAGFGVALIDLHGSSGYGQAFSDSVVNDLGGKPLEDLDAGLGYLLGKNPWLDDNRVCAVGAGYGGYLVNLIAGRWPRRFRCLVNHGGVFDLRTAYYTTDELAAPEAELGGTEYGNTAAYARQNPIDGVKDWRTPILVSHGLLDYRVPYSQGLAAFTALQRIGWPGELLLFPDEGHWISKPVNTVQWYEAVIAWLKRYTR